jgi:hypothetical protein
VPTRIPVGPVQRQGPIGLDVANLGDRLLGPLGSIPCPRRPTLEDRVRSAAQRRARAIAISGTPATGRR